MIRIGVLGAGAIGSVLMRELHSDRMDGVTIDCVVTTDVRDVAIGSTTVKGATIDEAIQSSDLIIECASQSMVREYGPHILNSGTDLLITSVGALADPEFRRTFTASGPGILHIAPGAVGGLDILGAAREAGPIHKVVLETTKLSRSLIQPWMDKRRAKYLQESKREFTLFQGSVRDAVEQFPQSMNVAASIALIVEDWDLPEIIITADPNAKLTKHNICAETPVGTYSVQLANKPSAENPRTSAIVPFSILNLINHISATHRLRPSSGQLTQPRSELF